MKPVMKHSLLTAESSAGRKVWMGARAPLQPFSTKSIAVFSVIFHPNSQLTRTAFNNFRILALYF